MLIKRTLNHSLSLSHALALASSPPVQSIGITMGANRYLAIWEFEMCYLFCVFERDHEAQVIGIVRRLY